MVVIYRHKHMSDVHTHTHRERLNIQLPYGTDTGRVQL